MRHITFLVAFLAATGVSLGFRNAISGTSQAALSPKSIQPVVVIPSTSTATVDRLEGQAKPAKSLIFRPVEKKVVEAKKPIIQASGVGKSQQKTTPPPTVKKDVTPVEKLQSKPVVEEKIMVGPDGVIYQRVKSGN